jgi:hypothetical protein
MGLPNRAMRHRTGSGRRIRSRGLIKEAPGMAIESLASDGRQRQARDEPWYVKSW